MFRPSHESLLRQNSEIDRLELPRIQDDNELEALKASQDLVAIRPAKPAHRSRLDPDRRYCRPWTRDFRGRPQRRLLQTVSCQIQVNSAVRTVLVQKKASPPQSQRRSGKGETASSHLAGITVDIQRRGMTREQVQWVEQYMFP